MESGEIKTLLISDFNMDGFSGCLGNSTEPPKMSVKAAPFGQVMPMLMDRNSECWTGGYDCVVIWTQPDKVIKSFRDLTGFKSVPVETILGEVDAYARAILDLEGQVKTVLVCSWVLPAFNRGYGMLDLKSTDGISHVLMRMNLRLAEKLKGAGGIYLLNTQKWVEQIGKDAFNVKLWYMGKMPFDLRVLNEAVRDVKAALNGVLGNAKKLIVVDLDDTLWGGILGDVGWEHVRLGGHDPLGEAFVDFQQALKSLTNRGLLLGIASKNEESVALEAIDKHPEMVLRSKDFAGWKISWGDKAQNILDLVTELNLGLQSVVFIDDNPVERARVREAFPEVLVPEWPEDKMLYKKALMSLTCFDAPSVSEEDKNRAEMYATEQKRKTLQKKVGSAEEWLKSLGIEVRVEGVTEANRQRTVQLLNKTNQMNLTTRRMTETELLEWLKDGHRRLWTFRVSDKFGDSGLTGIVSLDVNGKVGTIVDFILSCRVFGRKVEHAMMHTVAEYAAELELEELQAKYLSTEKNKPCLDFLKVSGLETGEEEGLFVWKMDKVYPMPEEVKRNVI